MTATNNHSAQNLIDCNQLGKHYGSTQALADVSLSLEPGAPVALIGPNGAGKTTFMSIICGFIRPSSGNVRVMGHAPGSHHALSKLSALPQDAWLDPHFSIERQLRHYAQLRGLSSRNARTETSRVLKKVQLDDRAASKPSQLSHGMRKRIMIAQAMIGDPELILLDEPTAGIDPPNVKIIRELISAESANATFIISSHNLDELEKVCTKVIHLADGRLKGISQIDENSQDGYLSITLRPGADKPPLDQIKHMAGVSHAELRGSSEIAIQYDEHTHPDTDIAVLNLLSQHNWRYRKLVKGRSLEEQLFSDASAS